MGITGDGLPRRVKNLETSNEYYEIFESVTTDTGTVTIPTKATILLNRYAEGADAIVTEVDSQGRPIDSVARESDGTGITTSFDIDGNFVFSGTPASVPVAIVYQISIPRKHSSNVSTNQIIDNIELAGTDNISNESNLEGATLTEALNNITTGGVFINADGGFPNSTYGGINPIDGGGV